MTAQLSPTPIFKGWANDGTPLAYGLLYSYAAGTSTAQATYVDSTQSTPNTNPINLNARGECALWLAPGLAYKFNLTDLFGNQIAGYPVDNILTINAATLPIDSINIHYDITAAEIAAGVTPTNYAYAPGHILRYGTNTTPGTTDMSAALTSLLAANNTCYIPTGTYYCAQVSSFALSSNQTLYGDGPNTILQFAYGAGNNLQGIGITKCTVRDIYLQVVAVAGVNTYIGALAFTANSTYCKAVRVSVAGVWGCGIYIGASSYCLVQNCSFVNFQGTNSDQADIYVGQLAGAAGSNYNIVDGNECFGGGWHGVAVQSSGTTTASNLYNLVIGNRIGQHVCYGIENYDGAVGSPRDTFNQFINNYIENIQGAVLAGAGGAGIYSVGGGGDVISGNTIRNCCVQTSSQLLAPAAIGIAQSAATGLSPTVVCGNNISGMTKYFGIYLTQCVSGVSLSGNTILHPASNSTGGPINFNGTSNIAITGGTISNLSNQPAINSNTNGAAVSNIVICGVTITSAGQGILFSQIAGTSVHANVAITGCQITCTGASAAFIASLMTGLNLSNNVMSTGATNSVGITNATQTRMSSNSIVTTGTFTIVTSGTCTSSMLDVSNYLANGSNQGLNTVSNAAAAGFNMRQLATAAPAAAGSVQALGDVAYNTAGVTPSAWVCTTAGTPGTFTGQTLP